MINKVRITLKNDKQPPFEIYTRVGQVEDNNIFWNEEGGLSSMLQEADRLKKSLGETTTIPGEVARICLMTEKIPYDNYEIKIEVNKK